MRPPPPRRGGPRKGMRHGMNGIRRHWLASAAFAALALPCALAAQDQSAAGSRPVVQPLPDPAAGRLAEVLRALAREPRSVSLLVQAGEAALALEDVTAADGFFKRAQAVNPADGRVMAGTASVLVRQEQPVEALRLYAQAEQAGAPMAQYLGDRGLAYDLVGDNARAQQDYLQALSAQSDPAVFRRMALSQAIAGNQPAAEATLLPMLQKTDLAAFRTRAFALAIAGKPEEAVSIAETMLPERIASRLAPYLRFMPRLTRAQQAAAANLGKFPQADQIGRDSPEIAALSAAAAPAFPNLQPPAARPAATGTVLAAGEPARETRSRSRLTARGNQRAAPTGEAQPARQAVRPATVTAAAVAPPAPTIPAASAPTASAPVAAAPVALARATPASAAPTSALPAASVDAAPQVAAVVPVAQSPFAPRPLPTADQAARPNSALASAPTPAVVSPAAGMVNAGGVNPTLANAVLAASSLPAPAAAPAPAPVVVAKLEQAAPVATTPAAAAPVNAAPAPEPPPPRDLRQAFADFTVAAALPKPVVTEGAVNMATFQPRREPPPPKPEVAKPAPAKPAPPPKPVIPSRHWVQIATGRDLGALGFDWRRLKRESGGLLDKHQPQYADWGQTNRLVVGPFASVREAEQFVGKLKDKKLDAFRFTSDQGEEVKPLK